MNNTSELQPAKIAYQAYRQQAVGKTFDGNLLPSFEELGTERQACWVAATQAITQRTEQEPVSREARMAILEAYRNAVEEAYFAVRPAHDNDISRLIFRHGFDRGHDTTPPAQPAPGDIRALKHRIHELEGDVLGYKQMLDLAEEKLKPAPVALDVTLDDEEIKLLRDMLGYDRDEFTPLRLLVVNGHSGLGLYAAHTDYEEDGAIFIAATTPPAQPPQRKPLTEEQKLMCWSRATHDADVEHKTEHQCLMDYGLEIEAAHGITKGGEA